MTVPTLDDLLRAYDGHPIRRCPGRYVLRGCPAAVGPERIAGVDARVSRHHPPGIRDAVVVTWLDRWGLISYHRADGTWLHTANTPDGFARKLADLGIAITPEIL